MKRRGNIVIAVLFMLLLSFSGLALLTHSLLHSKIIAARRGKWQIGTMLEQSILLQLHRYRLQLNDSDVNHYAVPETDFFNSLNFPDLSENGVQVKNHFSRQKLTAGGSFSKVRVFNFLTAASDKSRLAYGGQASVELLAGDIPLSEFSLLVHKDIRETQAAYLAAKGVEWSGQLINLPGKPAVSGECRSLLAAALKLSAPIPDWRQIREKFNLESSAAAIPSGIYLSLSDGLVETIFVEGDLQLLEFRAEAGLQFIVFGQDARLSELCYRPGLESVLWGGHEAVNGCRFAEKIFVHGNIWAIVQSGNAAFADDSCIQVLASGQMRVNTGLVGENLGLQKTKFAHLLLMTSNRDFISNDELNADIVLAPGSGSTIEAQLLAAGKVVHGDGLVKICGSLIAGDIQNSGCLQIQALAGQFDFPAQLGFKNFKCLKNFRVHFITEGGDE
ncbi:MAG: hypothetical protein JXI33_06140 [Candidatus Aminicenantes bacterium]|nr:hypothetical protein [Candidatus Aminicenantes bacterium]